MIVGTNLDHVAQNLEHNKFIIYFGISEFCFPEEEPLGSVLRLAIGEPG